MTSSNRQVLFDQFFSTGRSKTRAEGRPGAAPYMSHNSRLAQAEHLVNVRSRGRPVTSKWRISVTRVYTTRRGVIESWDHCKQKQWNHLPKKHARHRCYENTAGQRKFGTNRIELNDKETLTGETSFYKMQSFMNMTLTEGGKLVTYIFPKEWATEEGHELKDAENKSIFCRCWALTLGLHKSRKCFN